MHIKKTIYSGSVDGGSNIIIIIISSSSRSI